ncbi:MAG: alpha/beta hydrolase [Hamadaea sp.]|nr:alpha/beta hydrolase [Hamadaea sp.]
MVLLPFMPRPTVTHPGIVVADPPGYRPLQLDLHIPAGEGPFPVVFWVHGGGWMSGSRVWLPDSIAPFGFHQRLVDRGYAVADVDYRLGREISFPGQLDDVQAAIRWVRAYAGRFGLDADRFATLGESAGGQLAALAGLLGSGDTAVQAVVDWYGVSDFVALRGRDDPGDNVAMYLGGALKTVTETARAASPVHRVHAGAPPFLAVHGTDDQVVPFAQSVALAEALRGVGVRCDLLAAEGGDHCFVGYADIGGLIDAGIDFLDDVLK